jgi:hypothetical protein
MSDSIAAFVGARRNASAREVMDVFNIAPGIAALTTVKV